MKRSLVAAASLALVVAPFMTGPAVAASSCTWSAVTATISVTADDSVTTTLSVSGVDILLDGISCDISATTATVNTIEVTGGAGASTFVIDLAGGPFAPGPEVEATGTSEIEFSADLGSGTDTLRISGASGPDILSIGVNGANLNSDDDVDLTMVGVETVDVLGQGGADGITAAGDTVVGAALAVPLTAQGGSDADTISGGIADDTLSGTDGSDSLSGGSGLDELDGGSEGDSIDGGAGADTLLGGAGNDSLIGGTEPDDLKGGPGADDLVGGTGSDFAIYDDAVSGVVVNLTQGTASGGSGADTLGGIESVLGSGSADRLVGDPGNNNLWGAGGNDLLEGRAGSDVLFGQAGRDRVSYAGAPNPVRVNLGANLATGWGSDQLTGIEDVTGSSRNDRLTGNGSANAIAGGGGNDALRGGAGSDNLSGAGGRDVVLPGPGADRAIGGAGRDTLDLSTAPRSVTINLSTGKTSGDGADNVSGLEQARGSSFADRIVGNRGANVLSGRGGNDKISGLGGADSLIGAAGQDRLSGGGGSDRLTGGAAHDVLSGGAGDDSLNGGGGPDLLHGDGGNDGLNGGPGTDTCYQDAGTGPKTSCERPAPVGGGGGGGGGGGSCSSSYPDFCIPPPPPDLDCADISATNFSVVGSDPHGFDGDNDGVGCET